MFCISIYTRRPAQFWPDGVLRLPGLVDSIKQSGVDRTAFYMKTKRRHDNKAHVRFPGILNFVHDILAFKIVSFYFRNAVDFRSKL